MHQKRGFSLLEVVVAIALMGVLAAIIIPRLNFSSQTGKDASAQGALSATLNVQVQNLFPHLQRFATTAEVAQADPELTLVDADTPSTSAEQVSMASSTSAVGLAALSGSTCWIMRYQTLAPAGTHPTLYAYADHAAACSGTYALSLGAQSQGDSWSKPLANPSPSSLG